MTIFPFCRHDLVIEPPIIHHHHVEHVISPAPLLDHASPLDHASHAHQYRADCAICRGERPDGRPGRVRVVAAPPPPPPVVRKEPGEEWEEDWENGGGVRGVRRYVKDSPWKPGAQGARRPPTDKHALRYSVGLNFEDTPWR